jgi:hypothetical protein
VRASLHVVTASKLAARTAIQAYLQPKLVAGWICRINFTMLSHDLRSTLYRFSPLVGFGASSSPQNTELEACDHTHTFSCKQADALIVASAPDDYSAVGIQLHECVGVLMRYVTWSVCCAQMRNLTGTFPMFILREPIFFTLRLVTTIARPLSRFVRSLGMRMMRRC